MNILILANGTGGGHNAAAQALKLEFEKRGHTVDFMDPYSLKGKLSGQLTSEIINQTYIKSVQLVPKLFGLTYNMGAVWRKVFFNTSVHSPVYYSNRYMHKPLNKLFKKNHYDAVVMTHLYPGEMLASMRDDGYETPPTFWISTDYNCIAFTEEANSDYYVIASEELKEEYLDWGIPYEKIYPLGIPVNPAFNEKKSRAQCKLELGLDPDKHYFLISGGSVGAGNLLETVALLMGRFILDDDKAIIAICGNNEKVYKRLKKLYPEKLIMHRHTDKMADYIRASDVFITKPGGLSSTEAAVLGTPLIFTQPIPGGPESENIKYFEKHGMAIYVKSIARDLLPAIKKLQDSDVVGPMVRRQHAVINAKAAEDIVKLVEEKVK